MIPGPEMIPKAKIKDISGIISGNNSTIDQFA